jgi:uncharacterized protein YndB with AHSA1/START domain
MKIIHQVVDVDAGSDKVWWALTEPDGMAGWWSTRLESPPAKVGAVTKWTFAEDFNPEMEITSIDKNAMLVWRCVGGHVPWKDNEFRFELSPIEDGRTRLRFWQEYATELDDDSYGVYNFNWGYYLESLRLLCVTGTGKPFQVVE